MDPITEQITSSTLLALDAREVHETTTDDLGHLEATIRLRPNLGMDRLGAPRDMNLAITEEDELLDVQVTYENENGAEMMHEHFYGVHPDDLDTRLESLSHAPRLN